VEFKRKKYKKMTYYIGLNGQPPTIPTKLTPEKEFIFVEFIKQKKGVKKLDIVGIEQGKEVEHIIIKKSK
jgi:hypothetical protein